ncbi:MAG: hypothetical protein COB30_017100 [Ectothiorhodospiraceae bacterium]|nr:hypothetical protein [Ectothiorhodospiraceae bacterium]
MKINNSSWLEAAPKSLFGIPALAFSGTGYGLNPVVFTTFWIPAPAYYMPGQAQSAGMTDIIFMGWQ